MPKVFFKLRYCGCVVRAIWCGINKDKMYELGGHTHFIMCDKCKQDEENGIDTLRDMWKNDNITNNYGYAGWR